MDDFAKYVRDHSSRPTNYKADFDRAMRERSRRAYEFARMISNAQRGKFNMHGQKSSF